MFDTDAALDTFFQTCYEAGPDRCAVYDSSPSRISDNFDAFHEQLKTSPLPVFNNDKSYGILDYTTARQFAREMLYSPFSSFPAYAEALALAQKGNGSALYALAGTPNSFTCDCANVTNPENGVDALIAIGCNDAVIPGMTNAEWEQYYETAANVSKLSEVWVGLAMRCSYVLGFHSCSNAVNTLLTSTSGRGRYRTMRSSLQSPSAPATLAFQSSSSAIPSVR